MRLTLTAAIAVAVIINTVIALTLALTAMLVALAVWVGLSLIAGGAFALSVGRTRRAYRGNRPRAIRDAHRRAVERTPTR